MYIVGFQNKETNWQLPLLLVFLFMFEFSFYGLSVYGIK